MKVAMKTIKFGAESLSCSKYEYGPKRALLDTATGFMESCETGSLAIFADVDTIAELRALVLPKPVTLDSGKHLKAISSEVLTDTCIRFAVDETI